MKAGSGSAGDDDDEDTALPSDEDEDERSSLRIRHIIANARTDRRELKVLYRKRHALCAQ